MLDRLFKKLHGPVYASRLRVLVERIVPHLVEGDRVLDVGCGTGALGRALLDAPAGPQGVEVIGVDRQRRGDEPIPVVEHDGKSLPFDDGSFDVVILADVLHHEREPDALVAECRRVSRRFVIVKDHQLDGFLARARVALIDWAANAPHGVPCTFRYLTPAGWRELRERHGFELVEEHPRLRLYPAPYETLFGGRLQYLAVLRVPEQT